MVQINYFNEADEPIITKRSKKEAESIERPRTPADDFHDQIELLYSLPREVYPRKEVRFSPSGVTKCARELYYMNTDAVVDEYQIITPWKQRLPRNGEGVHEITQKHYLKMHKKLLDAGVDCLFKMEKAEIIGRKEFDVDGTKIVLSGRCDGCLIDRNGVRYIWEKKTKDKMKNFKKIKEPQDDHKAQVVCYSLIFGIPRTIFEIESLEKPAWNKDSESDIKHFYFESTEEMEQELLHRLATIVRAIEAKKPPAPEHDKCMFCCYKEQCRKDRR